MFTCSQAETGLTHLALLQKTPFFLVNFPFLDGSLIVERYSQMDVNPHRFPWANFTNWFFRMWWVWDSICQIASTLSFVSTPWRLEIRVYQLEATNVLYRFIYCRYYSMFLVYTGVDRADKRVIKIRCYFCLFNYLAAWLYWSCVCGKCGWVLLPHCLILSCCHGLCLFLFYWLRCETMYS